MSGLLARDLAWLGGGMLFVALTCALAQGVALLPAAGSRRRAPGATPTRAKPRCTHRPRTRRAERRVGLALSLALLLIVSPGVLAACVAPDVDTVLAVECGALAGMALACRCDLAVHRRVTVWLSLVAGALAPGWSFTRLVLLSAQTAPARVALVLAATLGAWLAGAAAGAWSARGSAQPGARRRLPFTAGDRALHAVALLLGVVPGCGFVADGRSLAFGLPALAAASLLAAGLGAHLMAGAGPWRMHAGPLRAGLAGPPPFRDAVSFTGVPDEWLVAACGSGSFAPACLYPYGGLSGATGHALQALPRGRHGRRGGRRRRASPPMVSRQRLAPPG